MRQEGKTLEESQKVKYAPLLFLHPWCGPPPRCDRPPHSLGWTSLRQAEADRREELRRDAFHPIQHPQFSPKWPPPPPTPGLIGNTEWKCENKSPRWHFFTVPKSCMCKFLGQGSNPCHSSNLSCHSDSTGSLTCCATRNSSQDYI